MWHIITDPHLGHHNIIEYSNRPFANTDEMDAAIIGGINERVERKDVMVIGGDFIMPRKREGMEEYNARFLAYRQRINCEHIIWVGGNHDWYEREAHGEYVPNFALRDALRWEVLCDCGRTRPMSARQCVCQRQKLSVRGLPPAERMLDAVHPMGFERKITPTMCDKHGIDPKFAGINVVFCHYSMRVWNKSHKDRPDGMPRSIMLYGHSHGELPGILNSFDCGWDVWKRPISLQEILEKLIPEHNKQFPTRFCHHPDKPDKEGS